MYKHAVALLSAFLLVSACTAGRATRERVVPPPPNAASEFSIYDLDAQWRDQTGATVRLTALAGKPRVLGMVYTHCGATCPLIVEAMKRVERRTGRDVEFVLVSLDPERDSSTRLAEFAREHALSSRWTLLTGSDAAVRELSAAIGARYRRVSPTELAHTNSIVVLDESGHIVTQQPSWDADAVVSSLPAATR